MTQAATLAQAVPTVLRLATTQAAMLPVVGLALGYAVPAFATACFPWLPWIVALAVLAGFMAAEGGGTVKAEARGAMPRLLALQILTPGVTWCLAHVAGATAEEAAWMALVAGAPISTVVLANAAAEDSRKLATLQVVGTLATPAILPLLAAAVADEALSPLAVFERGAAAILLPALLAWALRRGNVSRGLPSRADWRGIAVLMLTALAVARMHGVAAFVATDPDGAARAALLAVAAAATAVGVGCACRGGLRTHSAALAGGCRSGALAYAVIAPDLPPAGHAFMAMTVIGIYGLPPLLRRLR